MNTETISSSAEGSDVEYRDVTRNFEHVSVFEEEYRYWRLEGFSHFEARNKAIDYYRKFTRREVTESETMSLDHFAMDEDVTVDQVLDFNVILDRVKEIQYGRNGRYGSKEKLMKLLFLIIRMESLDEYLSPENAKLCQKLVGSERPSSMAEIATAMGFKVKANGCSNTLTEYKYGLQNLLNDFGLANIFNGRAQMV